MQESWEKWQPTDDLEKKYDIDSFEYTIKDGFKIILSESRDAGKQIIVTFKKGIYAHRQTDESFMQCTIAMLDDKYKSDFYGDWTFFKVSNSLYLKWLSDQSFELSDSYSLTHYSFLTANTILDIASTYEPVVEIIDTSNESPKNKIEAD